jgi:hypothetical protein
MNDATMDELKPISHALLFFWLMTATWKLLRRSGWMCGQSTRDPLLRSTSKSTLRRRSLHSFLPASVRSVGINDLNESEWLVMTHGRIFHFAALSLLTCTIVAV